MVTKKHYKKYRAKQKELYKTALTKHYEALTTEERKSVRTQLFIAQDGCCKICGQPEKGLKHRLAIDHCHITGHIRGLLCHRCNLLLGLAKDNVFILQIAIKYLGESTKEVV